MRAARHTNGRASPCRHCRQFTRTYVVAGNVLASFCFRCSDLALALAHDAPEPPYLPPRRSPRSGALGAIFALAMSAAPSGGYRL